MSFFRTLDASTALTRQRRRTYIEALGIIAPLKLRGTDLGDAEARLYGSKQPKAEAKRLVQFYEREMANNAIRIDGEVDFSDVQELRVTFIRNMGVVYESDAQVMLLKRMEREIANGTMTKERFLGLAATALKMDIGGEKIDRRKLEARRAQ